DSLKSISVPETVTIIGYRGVFNEGIENIDVSENNSYYSSEDGIMFDKDKTVLLQYPPAKEETEYTVPDNMDAIGAFAFAGNKNLKEITLPENVEVIGNEAFMKCDALESITIENPDCQINEFGVTISNGDLYDESYFNGVIYGHENSTAQAYAEEHGYNFAVIGTEPVVTNPVVTEPAEPIVTEVTTADIETTEVTTTYSTSIICVLTTTAEKRACENCEKLIYRSEGVITPLGMFLCTDCRALGMGGTLPKYPIVTETTQTTVQTECGQGTGVPDMETAKTTAAPVETAPALIIGTPTVMGDTNGDNALGVADISVLSKFNVNATVYPFRDSTTAANADVNYDNVIDASDTNTLIECVLGNITLK
ncbi:MAG: leucine-rich repeat protein, partial [Oscillospiraceae bacterium]|nr:leucine-rich repeat protein [Oscillospiraceae bacterium]